MNQRITRIILIVLLIAVGAYIAQPYIDRLLYSASDPAHSRPARQPLRAGALDH
jgi:hypothetical protein